MALSKLVKVGYAPEVAWGDQAVATKFLPVDGDPKFTPNVPRIWDTARRGVASKNFAAYEGQGFGEIEVGGPAYPDLIGHFFKSLLGSVTTSGATAPYTHDLTLNSNPAYSLCFEDNDPVQSRAYAGAKCQNLAVKFASGADGGMVSYTAKFSSKRPVAIGAAAVSTEPEAPFLGWQGAHLIAGGAFARVVSGDITLQRPVEPNYTSNNTKDPDRMDQGEIEVTASITTDRTADDLLKYTAVTQEALTLSFTYGAGAALRSLSFLFPKVDYGDGPAERDLGKAGIRLTWRIRALHDASVGGPVKVTLKNALTAI